VLDLRQHYNLTEAKNRSGSVLLLLSKGKGQKEGKREGLAHLSFADAQRGSALFWCGGGRFRFSTFFSFSCGKRKAPFLGEGWEGGGGLRRLVFFAWLSEKVWLRILEEGGRGNSAFWS